jgi:uncharacterized cofD-like protein
MKPTSQQHIVCIGGGTGTFVALRGLKQYPFILSAIVSMSDSGGSNKRIRDEFGLLPTSDIRQCLVALSDETGGVGLLRQLFMYRFEKGNGIAGMTFGNLFMAALTDIVGSQKEAIQKTSKVLRIKGAVIPVTLTDTNLYATYEDGHIVSEEHFIDEPSHDGRLKITEVSLKPHAIANPDAFEAIAKADSIVIGPGDLYTSILPNFLVNGVSDALSRTKAKIIYTMNLMTKFGQTYNFTAADHMHVLEKYIGKTIDYVLINSQKLPQKALDVYAKSQEFPVVDDLSANEYFTVVRTPLVNRTFFKKSSSDSLVRSFIRHDSESLAQTVVSLL